MVRLQGQHEVLVALAKEMAEGLVDCTAGSVARTVLLINWKKTRNESVLRPGSDCIPDEITKNTGLP